MPYADPEKRRQYHRGYYLEHRVLTGPRLKLSEEHKARIGATAGRIASDRASAYRASGAMKGYPCCILHGEAIRENRLAWERANGRPLRDDEIVHHIDGDRFNNDPSNLQAMTQSEHIRLHDPRGWKNRAKED